MSDDRMKDPFESGNDEIDDSEEEMYVEEKEIPPTIIKIDSSQAKEYTADAFRSPFKLPDLPSNVVQACQKLVAASEDKNGELDLISAHFNSYDTIYLLAYSANKKLYIARFNCKVYEFSNFRSLPIALPEEMYGATVYRETADLVEYYLQGKEKIWRLQLSKPNFNVSSKINDQQALIPFDNKLYPFNKKGDPERGLEAASLLTYNQLPVLVGGLDTPVKGSNLARRLIIGACWSLESDQSLKLAPGYVKNDFLIEKRQSPLCYIHGDQLICMGGNIQNPNNIAEFINLKECFKQSDMPEEIDLNRLFVASWQNESLTKSLNSLAPQSAHCIYENSIYIFSKVLTEQTPFVFYKFNFLNCRAPNSGNCWKILTFSENKYSSKSKVVFYPNIF